MSIDFRISVEELESQAEALEMVRKLVQEAMEQVEGFESSTPLNQEEEIVPLLIK
jgi:hypothetical protein